MSRSMNKAMVCAAVVAGLGTLSALGAMSMPKSSSCLHSGHGARSRRMMGAVSKRLSAPATTATISAAT